MKPFYLFFIATFCFSSIKSQTVIVSGVCMADTVILDPIGDIDGKPAYEGTGTVDGNTGVTIDVYWMPAPDNLWVLAYDGQPYFQNACDTTHPWSTGNVDCPWTVVSGQTCTGPNPLALRGAGALLVNIISFTASIENKQVVVKWKTASESNNKGFDVQRSQDGVNWTSIGFVNGSINSVVEKAYRFNDVAPLQKRSFYRLRQVDMDGKFFYSRVAVVNFRQSGFYTISNNPGPGVYRLHIDAGTLPVHYSVTDAGGRRILSKRNSSPGDQAIDISSSPAGIYLLSIQRGSSLFTERLIKL